MLLLLLICAHVSMLAAHDSEGDEPLHSDDAVKLQDPNAQVDGDEGNEGGADRTCKAGDAVCIKEGLNVVTDQYHACLERVASHLAAVEAVESQIRAGIAEGAKKENLMKAQKLNLQAQNQKLVSELTRFQSLGSENEGLQRSMRKKSTDHDVLTRQIQKTKNEVTKLEEQVATAKRNVRVRTEKCEDNTGILKDTYWNHQLRVEDVLRSQ